jgi:hypothetical protein
LAQFILRIAFSDPSDTTNPVLQGVFALASLQLHGSVKSFRYKNLVISSVKESNNWLDEKTLLQNLMATMLLYHHEVMSPRPAQAGHGRLMITALARIKFQRELGHIPMRSEKDHQHITGNPQAGSARIFGLP